MDVMLIHAADSFAGGKFCGGMRRAGLHKVRPYDGGHRQYQLVN